MAMHIELDDRQRAIVNGAEAFAKETLAPRAAENDVTGVFPQDVLIEMGERGYLGPTLPETYGGLGLDPIGYGLLVEAIEKGDCAASRLLTVHVALSSEAILKYGTEEQKERWLPGMAKGETLCAFGLTEPEHGSDAGAIETTYVQNGDTYVLNGRKKWISFSGLADLVLIAARNENAVSVFVVERDTPGMEFIPLQGLMAGRACHICEIALNNVVVKKENLLGPEGQGFAYVISTALTHGRYSIAWSGVGLAQASLNAMVAYAKQRKQFGEKLLKFQLVRELISHAVTNVYASRSLCLRAGEMLKSGSPDAIIECTIAKQFTAQIAFKIATDAVQLHGGNGCCNEYPVERYMREAKVLEIIEGTTQVLHMMISLHGLRH